jgi:glycosyltransferase involved in cell wall biosynthesis
MRRLIKLKKILSITYKDNAAGGPYQVTSDYKKFLNKRDFFVENIEFNYKFIFKYFLSKKKVKKYFNQFDLIHVHKFFSIPSILVFKIAELLSIPIILTLHGNLNIWSMKKSPIKKIFFLNFFSKIIDSVYLVHYLNNDEKSASSKHIKNNRFEHLVLPNCLDISQYSALKTENPIFKILFFGRINEKKNFLQVLDFANMFKNNNILNIKFIFVGPSDNFNHSKLKNKTKELGLEKFVEIRNEIHTIEEKNSMFNEVDLFVLPSNDEADSIAIKESIASGTPVVISKACKLKSDELSDKFIKVVNDGSSLTYYNELLQFYNNRRELKFLIPEMRSYAFKNFSHTLIEKKLPKIYLSCINRTFRIKNFGN